LPQIRELPIGETVLAHAALAELRTSFVQDRDGFVARIDDDQRPEGYRLLAAFEAGEDDAVAVAGFRRLATLAWGDILYVDDLVTRAAARRRGHARGLLEALEAEARALGCRAIHLDSGHHRYDAHRLYLGVGYRIASHHLVRDL
jgi:GNAT superfamily N-acetyltransferase